MKRLLISMLAGLLVGLLCLALAWHQWTGPGPAAPTAEASARVRIASGMTLSAAADTLVSQGLLAHRRTLLIGAKLTGQDRSLRAGLYELAYGQSPRDLLTDLSTGLSVQVVVALPEGLDSEEIAVIVAGAFSFSAARFLVVADSLARATAVEQGLFSSAAAVADYDSLLNAASASGRTRRFRWSEGLLAPDTYHFADGSDAPTIAAVLLAVQWERLQRALSLAKGRLNEGLEPLALLTLASVVESEARRDDERALIAAVYTNRLQRNWRLEADPTVAFVLGKKGKRLFFKDLKIDSPYNTYRHKGLPPGPIGAPGFASLVAAARPDSTSEALFFVSDGADRHVFSRTAREHEAAVQRFRAARSQGRRQGR